MPFSGTAYDDKTLALVLSAFERARVLVGASKQMPCELSRAIAGAIMYAVDEGERRPRETYAESRRCFSAHRGH